MDYNNTIKIQKNYQLFGVQDLLYLMLIKIPDISILFVMIKYKS